MLPVQKIESVNALATDFSGDNSRTPMQWDDSENGGSTAGTPWLKANPDDVSINIAAQQKDADTVLNYDKKLPALRKRKE